jgi:hypothetical protein
VDVQPVFVDVSGRRRRLIRHGGIVLGLLLSAYLAMMGVGLLTGTHIPMTPWTGEARGKDRTNVGADLGEPRLVPKGVIPVSSRPSGSQPGGTTSVPAQPGATPGQTSSPTTTAPATTAPATTAPATVPATTAPVVSPPVTPTPTGKSHTPPAWGKHKKTG